MSPVVVVPANEASWDDLAAIFGTRGAGARCFCQRYKLHRGEYFAGFPAEERADRLRQQTECGVPDAERTSGLVAYLGGEPVGWCAVEPRTEYQGLLRNIRIPWIDRDEERGDSSVWAVTCFFVRAGYRRRGVAEELAHAVVGFARSRGARALEGYPINTTDVIAEELHVGTVTMFAAAGFVEVSHPTLRRHVARLEL